MQTAHTQSVSSTNPIPCEALEDRRLFAVVPAFVPAGPTVVMTPPPAPAIAAPLAGPTPSLAAPVPVSTVASVAPGPIALPQTPSFALFGGSNRVGVGPGFDVSTAGGGVRGSLDVSRATGVGLGFNLAAGGGIGAGIDLTTGDITGLNVAQSSGVALGTSIVDVGANTEFFSSLTSDGVLFGSNTASGAEFFLGSDSSTIPLLLALG